MKTIIVLGLVAGMLTAVPAFAGAAATDGLCGPNAPEVYTRAGGYCDLIGGNGSLSLPVGNSADVPHYGMPTDEEEDDCLCASADT